MTSAQCAVSKGRLIIQHLFRESFVLQRTLESLNIVSYFFDLW